MFSLQYKVVLQKVERPKVLWLLLHESSHIDHRPVYFIIFLQFSWPPNRGLETNVQNVLAWREKENPDNTIFENARNLWNQVFLLCIFHIPNRTRN